jgi:hypothetical protein
MRAQQPWANDTAWEETKAVSATGHPFRYFWWMHTLERVYTTGFFFFFFDIDSYIYFDVSRLASEGVPVRIMLCYGIH